MKSDILFELKVEKFPQQCYGCEELGVLNIFLSAQEKCVFFTLRAEGLANWSGCDWSAYDKKHIFWQSVNKLSPVVVGSFQDLTVCFEVMKFTENYYKVLIEFHRSSPSVTQNGRKKPQPTKPHTVKQLSAESLIKNMKWKKKGPTLK